MKASNSSTVLPKENPFAALSSRSRIKDFLDLALTAPHL